MKFRESKLFKISLLLKGLDSILEIIGGFLLLFVNSQSLNSLVRDIFQHELSEDPKDFVANYLIDLTHFSKSAQLFGFLYLLSHGVIKLGLVAGLLKGKLWTYPLSIFVFVLFIIYQIYRFAFTHSVYLLLLTAFDILIIILIWLEYKRLEKYLKNKTAKR